MSRHVRQGSTKLAGLGCVQSDPCVRGHGAFTTPADAASHTYTIKYVRRRRTQVLVWSNRSASTGHALTARRAWSSRSRGTSAGAIIG